MNDGTTAGPGRQQITMRTEWRIHRGTLVALVVYGMFEGMDRADEFSAPAWPAARVRRFVREQFERNGEGAHYLGADWLRSPEAESTWTEAEIKAVTAVAEASVTRAWPAEAGPHRPRNRKG